MSKTSLPVLASVEALKVQPKPSKADLVAALVERARAKWLEERAAYDQKYQSLEKQADSLLEAELLKNPGNFTRSVRVGRYEGDKCHVTMVLTVIPPRLGTLINDLRDMRHNSPGNFDEKATRQSILEKMDTRQERVKALLSNPKLVKEFDKFLNPEA